MAKRGRPRKRGRPPKKKKVATVVEMTVKAEAPNTETVSDAEAITFKPIDSERSVKIIFDNRAKPTVILKNITKPRDMWLHKEVALLNTFFKAWLASRRVRNKCAKEGKDVPSEIVADLNNL